MRNAKVNPVVVLSLSVLVGLALVVLSLESVAKDPGPAKEPQPAAKKPEAAKESGPATKPAGASGKLVEMKLELPRPLFEGTPRNIKAKMRPVIRSRKVLAAPGLKNLAYEKKVTSSDEEPIIGELALANDGDKEGTDGSFVELGPQLQWVQIDLGAPKEIHLIVLWHYHREGRVYIRVFPDKPVTAKPAETRMGSGKGAPDHWVAVVKPGRMLFEIAGVGEDVAREAMRLASHKLPVSTRFVAREQEGV